MVAAPLSDVCCCGALNFLPPSRNLIIFFVIVCATFGVYFFCRSCNPFSAKFCPSFSDRSRDRSCSTFCSNS
ncbi:ORF1143 [White spot syndrome virus]|uniref:ORF1143 n=1 Tax=White spot syndrome virus TaxID=342409 RepID=A0A2D3I6H6_9VIRU|nr:ORF1143 [White spot syndrome virus]